MNFWVQVTLFLGDYFKWYSELLLHVLLEDEQKRKDVCSFYTPYGCSLGFKMSSYKYTNSLCGRLWGEPASPLTPFASARAGGASAAIYWSFCSFYKVFSFLHHPLEALSSLPFPSRSLCPFNSIKNSVLSIFLLTDTPEVSVRILLMLSREYLLWIGTGKFVEKELSLLVLCETCSWNQQLEFRTSFGWKQCYKRQVLRFSLEWANPGLTHTELRWIL